jgi:splicing factor 3B subunit 2
LKPDDPYFRTFFRVFETFRIQEPEVKKHEAPPNVSDVVARAALESKRLAAQRQDDSDDEEEEGDKEQPKISKKKLRRMNRLSVAQLKQLVERPDVVEMHDVTAPDPKLLIHLKVLVTTSPSRYCSISHFISIPQSTRNTVPVPRHWCFKRKYLQGKRGIEKPPFDLPDFIKVNYLPNFPTVYTPLLPGIIIIFFV